ncbi:unnamed protein product [Bursaphelenchus okinawaensis]|uniref:Uncharacterized protein n=1 Tax=Bursaphelenchus okinawaensis TaxID=465554 RepID=A0A811KNS3_9BILA|nr:unnamed protein product [Bursaphelenchus okinawaensis]CAG9106897.1 unnamed protein product [Bursaphelenchus okinawaensis]
MQGRDLDQFFEAIRNKNRIFNRNVTKVCQGTDLSEHYLLMKRIYVPSLMCSLVKNAGGSLDPLKFDPVLYVSAFLLVLCEGRVVPPTTTATTPDWSVFVRDAYIEDCNHPDLWYYCQMVKFFFIRDDPRRQGVCNAISLEQEVECLVTQVDPKERCQSDNMYEFSWNFLKFAAFEEDGIEFFGPMSESIKPSEYIDFKKKLVNNAYFNNVFHELREIQIVESQLYLHFMVSSLILNNLGKAARQVYLLYMARHKLISSGVILVFAFAVANLLYLFMNLYFVQQQFYPFFEERNNADFFRISNYSRQRDDTFLAAVSALRLTLNDRYGNVETGDFSQKHQGVWWLAIVESFLVNFSRSVAAWVLILIIGLAFYELRSSFCGQIRPSVKKCFIVLILISGVGMVAVYIFIGSLEYTNISYLNEVMQSRGYNQTAIENQCEKLLKQDVRKELLKGHAYFMVFFFVVSVLSLLGLFAYHKYKVKKSANSIPPQVYEEMKKSWKSLSLASFVYIASNFGTTLVEIQSLFRLGNYMTQTDVEYIANLYRWLYLLSLIDPVVHPLILIYRFKTLRHLHYNVQKELTNLQLKSILRKMSATFTSKNTNKITRFDDEKTSSIRPRRLRASVQQDLQWMLNYLEREKKAKMGEI